MRRFTPVLIIIGVIGLIFLLGRLIDTDSAGRGASGSVYNTGPNGLAALQTWLDASDFSTRRVEYVAWEAATFDAVDTVIIVAPDAFRPGEANEILQWVEQTGGTLIVVDNQTNSIFREFDVTVAESAAGPSIPSQLPLANPPLTDIPNDAGYHLETARRDGAVLIGSADEPRVLAFVQGSGVVYLSSQSNGWSNAGLRDENNARLVLNVLSRVPPGGTVAFDEVHHGRELPPPNPRAPVVFSPLVAALVYSVLAVGLWTLLAGRRFGTAVPVRGDVARRSSAEYVQSMASLFERGRQTGYMLSHYKTLFKRRIAKPYGFNPRLSDVDFVRELSRFTRFDEPRLTALLNTLSATNPNQEALVRIVRAADQWAAEFEQQT